LVLGSIREPVKEYTTVQVVPPTNTTIAVTIIGIEASLAIQFLSNRLGRFANGEPESEANVIVWDPE
jgi:hypothetical protein